jgi:hypothetical protein
VLDKSITLSAINDFNATYNVTLTVTALGSTDVLDVNITDTDSLLSPYSLGTIHPSENSSVSYLLAYVRNTTTYNATLITATANGTAIATVINATSQQITVPVPEIPTNASFVLDKIATVSSVNSTQITYNVTLVLTNKGGTNATGCNITDSDSLLSPYAIGNLSAGSTFTTSYNKTYARNSTTYYVNLINATANGTDLRLGSIILATSNALNITIPEQQASPQLTVVKNIRYDAENTTVINYTINITVVNSGGTDLTAITVLDADLGFGTVIDLNRTQIYNYSGAITITKAATNTTKVFVKASATADAITYLSNQISISIPGFGGPADDIVYAPATVIASAPFDTIITMINQNPMIGQDFTVLYWITNNNDTINYSSGSRTIYVPALKSVNTTVTFNAPPIAGTYKFRSEIHWVGGVAPAFDAFIVTPSIVGGLSFGGAATPTPTPAINVTQIVGSATNSNWLPIIAFILAVGVGLAWINRR